MDEQVVKQAVDGEHRQTTEQAERQRPGKDRRERRVEHGSGGGDIADSRCSSVRDQTRVGRLDPRFVAPGMRVRGRSKQALAGLARRPPRPCSGSSCGRARAAPSTAGCSSARRRPGSCPARLPGTGSRGTSPSRPASAPSAPRRRSCRTWASTFVTSKTPKLSVTDVIRVARFGRQQPEHRQADEQHGDASQRDHQLAGARAPGHRHHAERDGQAEPGAAREAQGNADRDHQDAECREQRGTCRGAASASSPGRAAGSCRGSRRTGWAGRTCRALGRTGRPRTPAARSAAKNWTAPITASADPVRKSAVSTHARGAVSTDASSE